MKGGFLILTNCDFQRQPSSLSFSQSLLEVHPLEGVEATNLSSSVIEINGGSLKVESCLFEGLSLSSGNGAAINAIISDKSSFILSSSTFTKCKAIDKSVVKKDNEIRNSGYGGAIFLNIENLRSNSKDTISIDRITFGNSDESNNDAAIAGKDIFILAYDFTQLDLATSFAFLSSSSDPNEGFALGQQLRGDLFTSVTELSFILYTLNPPKNFYIKEGTSSCMNSENLCSLTEVLNVASQLSSSVTIILHNDEVLKDDVPVNFDTLDEGYIITKSEDDINNQVSKSVTLGSKLSKNGGLQANKNLCINNINIFIYNLDDGKSAIEQTEATLELQSVIIGGVSPSEGEEAILVSVDAPVITIKESTSFSMKSTTIQNVKSSSAVMGLGINVHFSFKTSLSMDQVLFVNLTNEGGKGAGMLLNYIDYDQQKYGDFSSLTFTEDKLSTGDTPLGTHIYVLGRNADFLEMIATFLNNKGIVSNTPGETMGGTDDKGANQKDLFRYVRYHFYASQEGVGEDPCTTSAPCSLVNGLTLQGGDEQKVLHIKGEITIENKIELQTGTIVRITQNEENTDKFTINNGYISSEVSLNIYNFRIFVTLSPSNENVIYQKGGILDFSEVIIGSEDGNTVSISKSLIMITEGAEISFSNVRIQNIKLISGYGAGLYLDYSLYTKDEDTENYNFGLLDVIFDNCVVENGLGKNACIRGSSEEMLEEVANTFSKNGLLTDYDLFCCGISKEGEEDFNVEDLVNYLYIYCYLTNTQAGSSCTDPAVGCSLNDFSSSINTLLGKIIAVLKEDISLGVSTSLTFNSEYEKKMVVIMNEYSKPYSISVGSSNDFNGITSSVDLELKEFNILVGQTQTSTVISQASHSLRITGTEEIPVEISGNVDAMPTLGGPLISISGVAKLQLDFVCIQNIQANTAVNGVGLKITFYNNCNLFSLNEVLFAGLSTLGNGAGIYIDCSDNNILTSSTLTELSFAENLSAAKGKNMYIVTNDADNLKSISNYFFEIGLLETLDTVYGYYPGIASDEAVDLRILSVSDLYVKGSGTNEGDCAVKGTVCSMATAILAGNKIADKKVTVNLLEATSISTAIMFGSSTEYILRNSNNEQITMTSGGSLSTSYKLTIMKTNIILESGSRGTALAQTSDKLVIEGTPGEGNEVIIGMTDNTEFNSQAD